MLLLYTLVTVTNAETTSVNHDEQQIYSCVAALEVTQLDLRLHDTKVQARRQEPAWLVCREPAALL